jgi:ABC-type uncharacterized transport system substrate-binding protein
MSNKNSEADKHPPECPWHRDWHACNCGANDQIYIVCSSDYKKDQFKIETVFANISDAKAYIRARESETIDNGLIMDFRLDARTVHYKMPEYYKKILENKTQDEAHAQFMQALENMTPEQQRQSLINAGILDDKGNLTEPYKELGE